MSADSQLMIHCGGDVVSRDMILDPERCPVPPRTRSYCPISHGELLEMVEDSITGVFGAEAEVDAAYGLSDDSAKMFAVFGVKMDSQEHGVSYGLRNSVDKSLSAALCVGARVFVCDNLAFSSSGVNVFRKHTTHIYRDIRQYIDDAVYSSKKEYFSISSDWEKMKEIPLTTDQGYEAVGRALGHRVLTSTQASVALSEWNEPSHEEFRERNVYSLYQAFTEAAKKGTPQLMMTRYPAIQKFFSKTIN